MELGHNIWVNHWPGPRAYWAVCLTTRVFVNGSLHIPHISCSHSSLHHQFMCPHIACHKLCSWHANTVIKWFPLLWFLSGELLLLHLLILISGSLDFSWNKPSLHSCWEYCCSVSTGPWDFSTSLKDSPPTFPLLGFLYTCLVELSSNELIKMVVKITQVAVPYSKAACGRNSRLVSITA